MLNLFGKFEKQEDLDQENTVNLQELYKQAVLTHDYLTIKATLLVGIDPNTVLNDTGRTARSQANEEHDEVLLFLLNNNQADTMWRYYSPIKQENLLAMNFVVSAKDFDEHKNYVRNMLFDTFISHIKKNDFTSADLLLSSGIIDINGSFYIGPSALEQAKTAAQARFLLERGADVNNGSPLIVAIENNNLALVSLYCLHNADLEKSRNLGKTPLMIAAERGHLAIVDELIKAGAALDPKCTHSHRCNCGINPFSASNGTALSYAAWNRHYDVVKCLLEAGAKTYHTFKEGHILTLHDAIRNKITRPNQPRFNEYRPEYISHNSPPLSEVADLIESYHTKQFLFEEETQSYFEWVFPDMYSTAKEFSLLPMQECVEELRHADAINSHSYFGWLPFDQIQQSQEMILNTKIEGKKRKADDIEQTGGDSNRRKGFFG